MYTPTAKSYFAGGGFMCLGLLQAGVEVVQSLDIDKTATDCMRANPKYFGHSVVRADMREVLITEQPRTDIVVVTYPCTKYSPIADIHGTRTGDELYLHAFRSIALEKPEGFVLENVPGMKKFPVVMEAMTKLPDYYITVVCPVDAATWLPQRRKRLLIFGFRRPFNVSAPVASQTKPRLKDLIDSDPQVEMPEYVVNRINGKYRDLPIVVDPEQPDAIAPTCVAHYAKDLGTRLVKDPKSRYGVRPFSIREYARLQGIPDDFILPESREAYKLIGNGVPVDMARWAGQVVKQYFN